MHENTVLTELNLAVNEIGAAGAAQLAEAIRKNSVITDLGLEDNDLGDEGAAHMAGALCENNVLKNLDLENNGISAEGAAHLAGALRVNTVLKHLNLGYNRLGDEGAAHLAEALHDLTGRPVFDYNLEQPDVRADIREGQLWSEVCEHVQAHSMVACEAIKSGPRVEADSHQGLILNHAYCVLEARELAAERGSDPVKMLRLRNPWGSAPTWSGPFCAGSSDWMLLTAQARAGASQDGSTGCFWLSWDAFCSAFNRIRSAACPPARAPARAKVGGKWEERGGK